MTQAAAIKAVLLRDLETLRKELNAYPDESQIWQLPKEFKNSAGTITLHLLGNTRYFIGSVLGGSGYIRNRDAEFADRNVSRKELLERIDQAKREIAASMEALAPETLSKAYPEPVGGNKLSTGLFLIHLAAHFGYHLGQLDYHRRIVTGNSEGLGAQTIAEIADL